MSITIYVNKNNVFFQRNSIKETFIIPTNEGGYLRIYNDEVIFLCDRNLKNLHTKFYKCEINNGSILYIYEYNVDKELLKDKKYNYYIELNYDKAYKIYLKESQDSYYANKDDIEKLELANDIIKAIQETYFTI